MGAATDLTSKISAAQAEVDAAYSLHDAPIPGCSAEERKSKMKVARDGALSKVELCTEALDGEANDGSEERRTMQAKLLYLRGKAISCSEDGRGSADAERLLSDAVKLDPALIDAWNCLGECFWERGELETARYTFLGALEHGRTGVTLCHLSMLLRSMSGAAGLNEALLVESVALAKESVRLDPTNERAWSGLGSAHLSLHINVTGAADDLHMAHRALTQAGKVAATAENADLHLNHAMVCVLLDEVESALTHCTRAHELDPSLGADHNRNATWNQISKISDTIASKRAELATGGVSSGGAGNRKFAQMLADLGAAASQAPPGAAHCSLSQLAVGENKGRVSAVKVIVAMAQTGIRQAARHHCLIVADSNGDLMALTLYEMRGVPPLEAGTTLELREPVLVKIEATQPWVAADVRATAGFHLLRVEHPLTQVRINGSAIKPMQQRPAAQQGGVQRQTGK